MVSSNARKRRGTSTKTYKKEDSKIDFHGGTHGESSSDEGDYDDNYNKKRTRQKRINSGGGGGDEDVSSNDDWSDMGDDSDNDESSDEREETVEEKKIRLAKEYLNQVSAKMDDDDDSSSDEDEDDYDSNDGTSKLGQKLVKERLKRQGSYLSATAKKVFCSIIDMYTLMGIIKEHPDKNIMEDDDDINDIMNKYTLPTAFSSEHLKQFEKSDYMKQLRGHDLTPTCISLHQSGSIAYSGSKDNSLLSWDVEYGKKICTILPHWNKTSMEQTKNYGEILALANSDDGRYLAVGGRNCMVKVFDVRLVGKGQSSSAPLVSTFEGHKGAVTGLAFRKHSLDLFSSSDDRCIRNYNLDQMVYTETLYGHQGPITSIDCHLLPRPLSTGRDRTLRAWKIKEESHLIFRGGSKATSADCVASIKDDWCITGHENGDVSLWFTEKKKPIATVTGSVSNVANGGTAGGVVCADALRGSDFAVTGSNDGILRLWHVKTGKSLDDRGISPLATIPVHGFINGIAIGPRGKFCVAAIGQEHRLGRWERVAKAKNRIAIISLRENISDVNGKDDENKVT